MTPASARPHTVLTVLAGGLLALATPADPAHAAPPPVTVAVSPLTVPASAAAPAPPGTSAPPGAAAQPGKSTVPAYRIEVRNASSGSVETTVRQELPPGTSPTGISAGGRATGPGIRGSTGPQRGTEVTWQLKLPAGGGATLRTDLAPVRTRTPLAAPACAFAGNGDTPYDCATATWQAAETRSAPTSMPWWRRPVTATAGLAGVLLLAIVISTTLWRRRRARPDGTCPTGTASSGPTGTASSGPTGMTSSGPTGTVYGQPRAAPGPAGRRGRPAWFAVGLALTLLTGTAATVVWMAADQVTAVNTDRQPSSGAWIGRTSTGQVGSVLRDVSFEFTVYRLACPDPASPDRQRCLATVGLRNVSGRSELWHGQLQRAYLPDGNWVGADEAATRAVNNGRDLFADPVPAGERMLFPLVFTTPGPTPPTRIELRGTVFSAGVSVAMP